MPNRRIVVEFLGQDRSLTKTANSAEKSTSKLGARMKTVAKVGAAGLAVGAVLAGKAMFDMAKGAIADEAAQKKLANTLKNTTGATDSQIDKTEDWISAQGRALGVTDDDLRPALARLATATGDVGAAQRQASIAMDVAAGTGKSLKQVTEAMVKAQNGNVGALGKLGIATKDAEGKTISFDDAMGKLAQTHRGAAATSANTLEGKMGRLRLVMDETKEAIGARLIPIVTKMADWFLNKGLPAISAFGGWMRDNLGPIFERIQAVVRKVMGGMNGDVGSSLADIKAIIQDFVTIVRALWARFGSSIIALVRNQFNTIRGVIRGVLLVIRGIMKTFSSLLKGDWKGVWEGVKMILRGAMTAIKAVVRGAFTQLWIIVKEGGKLIVSAVKNIPGLIVKGAAHLFKWAGRALINAMIDGLKNAAGLVSDIAGNVWNAVKTLLNDGIGKINSALEFKISVLGKGVSINPPDIPRLATGGIVKARRGGTLALLGEGRSDEAVVPLPRGGLRAGDGARTTIIIQGALDPNAVARQIEQLLTRRRRLTGQSLAFS